MKTVCNVILSLACLLCMACGSDAGGTKNSSPVKVKVKKMEQVSVGATRTFSGPVEEMSGTLVSFPVGGMVKHIAVGVGQRVAAGQLLATLDPTTYENAYKSAVATLSRARDAYERMKQLHDKGSLPEMQWVEVQSKLQQAEAMERIARKNLDDCMIYAPFAGVVSAKEVEVGQVAAPGVPAFKVVQIDRVKVKIAVPEAEIAGVVMGQEARVTVAALGNRTFDGRIIEKGIEAHPLSHTYEVKALVDNPEKQLMPGMIAGVVLLSAARDTALVVPGNVVQLDPQNRPFVWVAANGKAARRFVTCGALTAGGVVVSAGLKPGDEVLVEGQQKVSENTPLDIIR